MRKKSTGLNKDVVKGMKMAAALASEYDSSSIHDYRLEDCILSKLNVRKAKPRKNKHNDALIKSVSNWSKTLGGQWMLGYAAATAAFIRQQDDVSAARYVISGDGLSLKMFEEAGVEEFDMEQLRKTER